MKGTTNSQRGTGGGGEKLVISLKTNQASHEDLIGAKFSVVINGNATEYTWQGASMTIPVTPMLNYTVEFGEVEGYAKPESVTHIAVAGNDRFVTGTYNTELVTVNVSADEGSVSGYEVSIITNVVGTTNRYIPIEYIEATGSQYTDTWFIPTVNTKLISELEVPAGIGNKNIFCASTNFVLNSKSDNQLEYKLFNVIGYTHVTTPSPITSRFKVEYSPQTLKFNDEVIASPNASSLSNSYTMRLFSREGGSSTYYGYGKIYYLKLYESGELVRDYIPVKSLDGKIGLYDKINDTFISSNSGTEFVGGNVLGTTMTQTTPSASYKIPYDTSYTIKASDVSGYTAPSEQSFTASQSKRNVKVVYQYKPMGVFTVDANGNLGDKDTPISNGVAVAVITENVRIMFNPVTGYYNGANVGNNNISYIGDNLVSYSNDATALTDYDGENNNRILYNAWKDISGSDSYGVMKANAFKFSTPKKPSGRLPSLGELAAICENFDDVKKAVLNAGMHYANLSRDFWTTTRWYDSQYVYFIYTDITRINSGNPLYKSPANYQYHLLYVTSDF